MKKFFVLFIAALPAAAGVMPLDQDAGFNDEPSMARASEASLYVAWNSFRDGADSLQVARYELKGEQFHSLGSWRVIGGARHVHEQRDALPFEIGLERRFVLGCGRGGEGEQQYGRDDQ